MGAVRSASGLRKRLAGGRAPILEDAHPGAVAACSSERHGVTDSAQGENLWLAMEPRHRRTRRSGARIRATRFVATSRTRSTITTQRAAGPEETGDADGRFLYYLAKTAYESRRHAHGARCCECGETSTPTRADSNERPTLGRAPRRGGGHVRWKRPHGRARSARPRGVSGGVVNVPSPAHCDILTFGTPGGGERALPHRLAETHRPGCPPPTHGSAGRGEVRFSLHVGRRARRTRGLLGFSFVAGRTRRRPLRVCWARAPRPRTLR